MVIAIDIGIGAEAALSGPLVFGVSLGVHVNVTHLESVVCWEVPYREVCCSLYLPKCCWSRSCRQHLAVLLKVVCSLHPIGPNRDCP
jgi:hypothetical protein